MYKRRTLIKDPFFKNSTMAGFDPSLDKEVFAKEARFDSTAIKVAVMQYNEGMKKLQLSRESMTETGEPRFAKLGRLTKQEAEAVLPLFKEALDYMD